MSKLCQCRKDLIGDSIFGMCHLNGDDPFLLMEAKQVVKSILDTLESDCVCEKKEWYKWSCPHCEYSCWGNSKKGHEENVAEHKQYCPKEKQSQSSEKKEIRNLDCPNKCTVDEAVERGCLYCAHKAVYKSKQSQSPCEHEWKQEFISDGVAYWPSHKRTKEPEVVFIPLPLWGCGYCGLVTCVDPNQ